MPVGTNILPSTGVIRCLFGPVDHEMRGKELSRLSKSLDQMNSQKWNFDFKLETPMTGQYKWEVVEKDSVPKAYEMTNLDTIRRFARVSLCSRSSDEASGCATSEHAGNRHSVDSLVTSELLSETVNTDRPSTPVNTVNVCSKQSRKRRRTSETEEQLTQRLITDYYKSVKSSDALMTKRRKLQL